VKVSRILLVEDDPAVRDIIKIALEREGMTVEDAGDGESALRRFRSFRTPDLVVLDIMLPGVDGITVCQEIRRMSNVPIVVLTARDDERDVVVGLEVGADDYVTKPVSPAELVSRVRAHLRRRRMDASDSDQKLEFPGLVIDLLRRQVWAGEENVYLTATEFEILSILAAHPGRVFSRHQIMEQLWEGAYFGEAHSTVVHIQHIREKIEPDPQKPRYILTVRSTGYKFAEDVVEPPYDS
jgi:two-component system, OmpR family, alkaline phosphatase synthesis response regulator PhoP